MWHRSVLMVSVCFIFWQQIWPSFPIQPWCFGCVCLLKCVVWLRHPLERMPLLCVMCCVVFSFTSSLGVGYMMVCTESYPNVLAFCFLDELQREFIVTYDTKRINSAVRPYSFIEFGKQSNLNVSVCFMNRPVKY